MANTGFFVDEAYLKAYSTINANIDANLLAPAVRDAQILHIQIILGSKLYQKLVSLIIADPTISNPIYAKYKTLYFDYVKEATAQWAMYECLPYLKYKIMNTGPVAQNSENSTSIGLDELKFLQQEFKNKAEFYSQRIVKFLIENMNDYPEYSQSTDIDDIKPATNPYFSGIQIPDSDCGCGDIEKKWNIPQGTH